MKTLLQFLVINCLLVLFTGCSNVGVGGTVSGGSGGINAGAGVNIRLYTETNSGTQHDRN